MENDLNGVKNGKRQNFCGIPLKILKFESILSDQFKRKYLFNCYQKQSCNHNKRNDINKETGENF